MAKYIKCEAVLALSRPDDPNDERCAVTVATAKRLIRHALTTAPAADVAPVVHASWIIQEDWGMDTYYTCSACKEDFVTTDGTPTDNLWNYCPHCGAKMDGGAEDA